MLWRKGTNGTDSTESASYSRLPLLLSCSTWAKNGWKLDTKVGLHQHGPLRQKVGAEPPPPTKSPASDAHAVSQKLCHFIWASALLKSEKPQESRMQCHYFKTFLSKIFHCGCCRVLVGGEAVVRTLVSAGELSLSCTRLLAGWVTTLWLSRPLSVSQHGQLSQPSLRGR